MPHIVRNNRSSRPAFGATKGAPVNRRPQRFLETLEDELSSHLQLSRTGCAVRTPELALNLPKRRLFYLVANRPWIIARIVEIRMIEQVVSLQPQFDTHVLPDLHAFSNAHIEIYE